MQCCHEIRQEDIHFGLFQLVYAWVEYTFLLNEKHTLSDNFLQLPFHLLP